ncbi:MAG: hypothetical protein V8R40_05655 [Dysosmobacter sp.]
MRFSICIAMVSIGDCLLRSVSSFFLRFLRGGGFASEEVSELPHALRVSSRQARSSREAVLYQDFHRETSSWEIYKMTGKFPPEKQPIFPEKPVLTKNRTTP